MSHHRLGTSWASPVGLLIAFLNLGTGGCPVQTTCGVYDRRQEHPQETDAQSYTCRATFQLADGETITSPEAARLDLLARKESLSIRLADLRAELDRLEEGSVVYRGLPPPSEQAATQQIERIKRESAEIGIDFASSGVAGTSKRDMDRRGRTSHRPRTRCLPSQ
ncbi:MAG TPA: hypothetical protein VFQ34_08775 [Nitrospiraceae bacterium]|nr:hypothetical protein [Nitrospiraceae bacterium]